MSGTYSINIICSNCDHVGTISIRKGTKVPNNIECPNCGCETARKDVRCLTRPHILPFMPERKRWSIVSAPDIGHVDKFTLPNTLDIKCKTKDEYVEAWPDSVMFNRP